MYRDLQYGEDQFEICNYIFLNSILIAFSTVYIKKTLVEKLARVFRFGLFRYPVLISLQ